MVLYRLESKFLNHRGKIKKGQEILQCKEFFKTSYFDKGVE